MARKCEKTGAKAICSLEQTVYVLLNDKSRMKGDFQVRFREKFEVKVLLLTRLRGRRLVTASYSIFSFYKQFELLHSTESKPRAVHLTCLHLDDDLKDMS